MPEEKEKTKKEEKEEKKEEGEKKEEKGEEPQEPLRVPEPTPPKIPQPEKVRTSNLEDDLDLFGTVTTTSTDLSTPPKSNLERIKVYVSGTTYRLYVWDNVNKTWRYVNLT